MWLYNHPLPPLQKLQSLPGIIIVHGYVTNTLKSQVSARECLDIRALQSIGHMSNSVGGYLFRGLGPICLICDSKTSE